MIGTSTLALRSAGALLLDAAGGQVMLRGINLGGDCKLPFPHGGTHHPGDFADHREVSFIGRPFPLDQADVHFERLRHWGFNCLRLLTTWEAVEHAGPGIYDLAYLDYLVEIVERAGAHGLRLFIDFHQDAWSRMSGGSGAPGWVFESVGLDFKKFPAAGAAIVMQSAFDYADSNPHQAGYPPMIWSSNYLAPANAIMWTLFWGGRLITPDFRVGGVNVQDFLQGHLLRSMNEVARRVGGLDPVLGFDSLNEPSPGWLETPLSGRRFEAKDPGLLPLKPGPVWSPLDALAVAQGLCVRLPVLEREPVTAQLRPCGERSINPQGVRIWRDDVACPFEAAGIYSTAGGSARALREDAFIQAAGRRLSVADDGYGPWFHRVAEMMRRHRPDWLLFAEIDPHALPAGRGFPRDLPSGLVNASHWYDVAILYSKAFTSSPDELRDRAVRYRRDFGIFKRASAQIDAPALLGEFGIPFDLHHGRAYSDWKEGDRGRAWNDHIDALHLMFDAIDEGGLHAMLWNYTASNRNDPRIGDGWNQEDLSIFSIDQFDEAAGADSGGRAVTGFCRPYVRRVQGRLARMSFDASSRVLVAELEAEPDIAGHTEIYLPKVQFPQGIQLGLDGPGAQAAVCETQEQLLRIRHVQRGRCSITVSPAD